MGFKQVDLVPISTIGPTTTSPAAKSTQDLIFQTIRTDTVAVAKLVLPADASVLSVTMLGSVASNAATTATVTITLVNNTGTISTGVVDVKANGATTALVQMSALPNLEGLPAVGDIQVKAVYAETGTASTLGGPWIFRLAYVR